MKILALETATDRASCALLIGQEIHVQDCPRVVGQNHQQSETLLPAVASLLAAASVELHSLDAIAFDVGPGAFTSLRMGCALAQGLAIAHDLPVIPVGSLEAMAFRLGSQRREAGQIDPVEILVLLDARMQEVYSLHAQVGADGQIRALSDIQLSSPEQVRLPNSLAAVVGNAASAYPLLAERLQCELNLSAQPLLPDAAAIAQLAALAWQRGDWVDPALAAPRYVRDKVAKTVAERMAEGGRA